MASYDEVLSDPRVIDLSALNDRVDSQAAETIIKCKELEDSQDVNLVLKCRQHLALLGHDLRGLQWASSGAHDVAPADMLISARINLRTYGLIMDQLDQMVDKMDKPSPESTRNVGSPADNSPPNKSPDMAPGTYKATKEDLAPNHNKAMLARTKGGDIPIVDLTASSSDSEDSQGPLMAHLGTRWDPTTDTKEKPRNKPVNTLAHATSHCQRTQEEGPTSRHESDMGQADDEPKWNVSITTADNPANGPTSSGGDTSVMAHPAHDLDTIEIEPAFEAEEFFRCLQQAQQSSSDDESMDIALGKQGANKEPEAPTESDTEEDMNSSIDSESTECQNESGSSPKLHINALVTGERAMVLPLVDIEVVPTPRKIWNLHTRPKMAKACLDTAATDCIASAGLFQQQFWDTHDTPTITTAGGHNLRCYGSVRAAITYEGWTTLTKFFISPDIEEHCYLSAEVMKNMKILPPNFPHAYATERICLDYTDVNAHDEGCDVYLEPRSGGAGDDHIIKISKPTWPAMFHKFDPQAMTLLMTNSNTEKATYAICQVQSGNNKLKLIQTRGRMLKNPVAPGDKRHVALQMACQRDQHILTRAKSFQVVVEDQPLWDLFFPRAGISPAGKKGCPTTCTKCHDRHDSSEDDNRNPSKTHPFDERSACLTEEARDQPDKQVEYIIDDHMHALLHQAADEDLDYQLIRKQISMGKLQPIGSSLDSLLGEDLFHTDVLLLKGDRIIVPNALTKAVVQDIHERSGHQGLTKATQLLNKAFFWMNCIQDLSQAIADCPKCNANTRPALKMAPASPTIPATGNEKDELHELHELHELTKRNDEPNKMAPDRVVRPIDPTTENSGTSKLNIATLTQDFKDLQVHNDEKPP